MTVDDYGLHDKRVVKHQIKYGYFITMVDYCYSCGLDNRGEKTQEKVVAIAGPKREDIYIDLICNKGGPYEKV